MKGGKLRLLLLINSLNAGGAERQLCELVKNLDRTQFDVHVVVFYDAAPGPGTDLEAELAAVPGLTFTRLHKRRGALGYALALPRLFSLLVRTRPDVLHGYLEGNLPLLLLGKILGKPVVWGIRRTSQDWARLDLLSRALMKLMVKLSPWVDLTLFNSEAGLRNHAAMGLRSRRMHVVPNGFDVSRFRPDAAAGLAQRHVWGLGPEVPLVGIVGRLDPVKDHPTFLRAAARLSEAWPQARFLCAGAGREAYLHQLQDQAQALGLKDRVLWPGACAQMPSVYNALNLLVLSSSDEGFPNALGEAMACGIPCVTTRVGDAEALVGGTGAAVSIGDDQAISDAASRLLGEAPAARSARALACRERIVTTFSTASLARNTETLLRSLAGAAPAPGQLRGARYLLRFDDLCPTMAWPVWNAVEALLVEAGVHPILAVIPDNRDPKLMVAPPAPDFWDRVRAWQARGWAIGLHGYQHTYVNAEPGLLRLNRQSEFAGLGLEAQLDKLSQGLAIFRREGITADAWIAPAHSFDAVTVQALAQLGITTISDGMALGPYRDVQGSLWVPQQFATMRWMPGGIWTFCYHLEDLTPAAMATFTKRLRQLGPRMLSLQEAASLAKGERTLGDRLVGTLRQGVSGLRRLVE